MRSRIAVGTAGALALSSCLALAATATAATPNARPAGHHAHHKHFATGLDLAALKAHQAALHHAATTAQALSQSLSAIAPFARAGAAPASADLTQYALSPGDQGQVGSCVTWATGYTGYGILMNEKGTSGAPMAPMYIYSQIARGNDTGTYASVALPMEKQQGIDTQSDYWQGTTDFTTQPDANETANAAKYKLSGFVQLPTSGTAARTAIEDAISQGEPVPIGFSVQQSFMDLNAQTASDYSYTPGDTTSDPVVGGHEITIVAYNDKGVTIENSWGTGNWGNGGFANLPWSFFDAGVVDEAHAMGKLA